MLYQHTYLLQSNLIIREWLNGSLFPLSAFLTVCILTFLYDTRKMFGKRWTREKGVATACSLAWIFFCESIRAGGVWLILRSQNDGVPVPDWVQHIVNVAFMFSAAGLIVTILRCTFLFSPPRWGNRYWMISAGTTVVFLILSHLLPPLPF